MSACLCSPALNGLGRNNESIDVSLPTSSRDPLLMGWLPKHDTNESCDDLHKYCRCRWVVASAVS